MLDGQQLSGEDIHVTLRELRIFVRGQFDVVLPTPIERCATTGFGRTPVPIGRLGEIGRDAGSRFEAARVEKHAKIIVLFGAFPEKTHCFFGPGALIFAQIGFGAHQVEHAEISE